MVGGEASGGGLELRDSKRRRVYGEWDEPAAGWTGPGGPGWSARTGGSCNVGRAGPWGEWVGDGEVGQEDGRGAELEMHPAQTRGGHEGSSGRWGLQADQGGGAEELLQGWGRADSEIRGGCLPGSGGWGSAGGCDGYAGRGGGGRGGSGQGCSRDVAPEVYGGRTLPRPPWDGGAGAGARNGVFQFAPALGAAGPAAAAGGGEVGPRGWAAELEVMRLEMEVQELRRRSREAVIAVVARLRGGAGPGQHGA